MVLPVRIRAAPSDDVTLGHIVSVATETGRQRAGGRSRRRRARRGRDGVGQRRAGRDPGPSGAEVPGPRARLQLPRPARQPGQLRRQPRPADAGLPARGARGRDRPRLRQGDRAPDGRGHPQQRGPDARHHGHLQRLVRSRPDADHRGDRAGGRGQAPALDRLDPHLRRPGRADPGLCQVGRPARLGRGGPGLAGPRVRNHPPVALRTGLRLPRREPAGSGPRRNTRDPRRHQEPVAPLARPG